MAKEVQKKRSSRRADTAKIICTLLLAIAVLAGASWMLWTAVPDGGGQSQKSPFLAIKTITVKGDTRYDHDAIIQVSGLFEGQSLLAVNKIQAYENIAAAFPYIESMEITNTAVDEICITVKEATPMGAMYCNGKWLIVSTNGKGLEELSITSDTPPRYRYLKGAVATEDAGVGRTAMDERSYFIVKTLYDAITRYKFADVSEIDLSDTTDISFFMEGTLRVKLGSDTNLEQEMEVLSTAIPKLKNTYGEKLRGVVDASSYSRNDATARVIYSPQEVVDGTF